LHWGSNLSQRSSGIIIIIIVIIMVAFRPTWLCIRQGPPLRLFVIGLPLCPPTNYSRPVRAYIGILWDGCNRIKVGRATCSLDDGVYDQVGEATWPTQSVRGVSTSQLKSRVCAGVPSSSRATILPHPHAEKEICLDRTGDRTVKSDRSLVVGLLHRFVRVDVPPDSNFQVPSSYLRHFW